MLCKPGGYYHQTQFVSNSELTSLRNIMRADGKPPPLAAYRLGSLVDAQLTEAGMLSKAQYEEGEWDLSERMALAGRGDSTLAAFLATAKMQHEVYRNRFEMEHEGIDFSLPMRCKYDLYKRTARLAADIKTTSCTSQAAFVASILSFEYHRQGALYMDLGNADQFMFIGIGKKPKLGKHPIFKFVIRRGDAYYEAGRARYLQLANLYYFLIFQIHTL